MREHSETRQCPECGADFRSYAYMRRRGWGLFCSHVCASTYLIRQRLPSFEERFWSKVDKGDGTGCWLWTGDRNPRGYGRFWRGKRNEPAHRVSWEIANGQPFPIGKITMHTCDQPSCVRPDHLHIGTNGENSADMAAKQRGRNGSRSHPESRPRGENNARARFTWVQVDEMRRLYGAGVSQRKIAAQFGTAQPVVQRIVTGKAWAHR